MRRSNSRVVLVVALLVSSTTNPFAQEILRTFEDLWPTPFSAEPLAAIQDMDGDGIPDIVIGDSDAREVRIFSSATGALLRAFSGNDPVFGYHVVVPGDVTGDGFDDLLISGYQAQVWSGATLQPVWFMLFFDSASAVGDINKDGLSDFVLAGYGVNEHQGFARLLYGGTFDEAYLVPNPTLDSVQYGHASAAMGDVDGDGLGDYAISAPATFQTDTVCQPGEVFVHSGEDGRILYRLEGEGIRSYFGGALASPGDVTGDGIGDLAVGAFACCQDRPCTNVNGKGRISFYDGASGALLEHVLPDPFGAHPRRSFGEYLLAIGDLDGNGWGDVLTNVKVVLAGTTVTGEPRQTGTLLALDGASRAPIYRMWNPHWERCPNFPSRLAVAGDVNGDDFPDWFLSASCSALRQPHDRVHVISGAPVGVRSLGEPCGGAFGAPRVRIGATGVPAIGTQYAIHLTGVEEGATARLLLGDLRPARALSIAGRCAPWVEPVETRTILAKDVRPGVAVATAIVSIPNDPSLIGMRFHAQWSIGGPVLARTTRVLVIEVQPSNPLRGW